MVAHPIGTYQYWQTEKILVSFLCQGTRSVPPRYHHLPSSSEHSWAYALTAWAQNRPLKRSWLMSSTKVNENCMIESIKVASLGCQFEIISKIFNFVAHVPWRILESRGPIGKPYHHHSSLLCLCRVVESSFRRDLDDSCVLPFSVLTGCRYHHIESFWHLLNNRISTHDNLFNTSKCASRMDHFLRQSLRHFPVLKTSTTWKQTSRKEKVVVCENENLE